MAKTLVNLYAHDALALLAPFRARPLRRLAHAHVVIWNRPAAVQAAPCRIGFVRFVGPDSLAFGLAKVEHPPRGQAPIPDFSSAPGLVAPGFVRPDFGNDGALSHMAHENSRAEKAMPPGENVAPVAAAPLQTAARNDKKPPLFLPDLGQKIRWKPVFGLRPANKAK